MFKRRIILLVKVAICQSVTSWANEHELRRPGPAFSWMTARSILAVHQSTVQKNSTLKQFSRPPPIFCLIYRWERGDSGPNMNLFVLRTPPNKLLTPLTAYKAFITMQNDAKKGWKGGVDTRDGPPALRGGEESPFSPHCGEGAPCPAPAR